MGDGGVSVWVFVGDVGRPSASRAQAFLSPQTCTLTTQRLTSATFLQKNAN